MTASSGSRTATTQAEERLSLMVSAASREVKPLRPGAVDSAGAGRAPGWAGAGRAPGWAGAGRTKPAPRGVAEALTGVLMGITSRSGRAGGLRQ